MAIKSVNFTILNNGLGAVTPGGGETIVNNYYGDSGGQLASDDRQGFSQDDGFASDADYQSDDMGSDDSSYDV